ncbi:MAG: ArsA family ATPase [Myxococcaceae bacterium]
MKPLAEALRSRGVVVCVGPGGVGKTTLAAALALQAAALGRDSLVCTIDPARRLASALGLSELGNVARPISQTELQAAGIQLAAPVAAMMLDMKQSWDELIARSATPQQRDRILGNRFYQSLSSVLAGSQEYIALEKLWELHASKAHQLVVLDTPPTAHALDFLDAPARVLDFLGTDTARWLLKPALRGAKLGFRLVGLGGNLISRTLSGIVGGQTLSDLATFLLAMSGLNETFQERARAVSALLASDETVVVLVTGPAAERREEAIRFHHSLLEQRLAVAAVVVNQVHAGVGPEDVAAVARLPEPLRGKLARTISEANSLAEADAEGLRALRAAVAPTPLLTVPRFPGEVHDLGALWRAGAYLVSSPVPTETAAASGAAAGA